MSNKILPVFFLMGACAGSNGATSGAGTATSAASASSSGASSDASSGTSGTAGAASSSGGMASSTGSSTGFMTASHAPLPEIASQGGPLLTSVDVVTISFPGVQVDLDAYVDALLASDWMAQVGREYNLSAGSRLAAYHAPDAGPAAIDDAQIQLFLAGLVDAGSIPAPTASTLYAIEFPPATTVTSQPQGASTYVLCQQEVGYHNWDATDSIAYAVIADCSQTVAASLGLASPAQEVQFVVSHEIFEGASDPQTSTSPAYILPQTALQDVPGLTTSKYELADLCLTAPPVVLDAGLVASRIWSNAAADAGVSDPCVPAPPGEVYFNVNPVLLDGGPSSPANVAVAAAGLSQPQTFTFQLTGWSTAPVSGWELQATAVPGSLIPTLVNAPQGLWTASINNGETQALSVTVPAQLSTGSYAGILILSTTSAAAPLGNTASIGIYVE